MSLDEQSFRWTDENTAECVRLWKEGAGGTAISKALGCTRNAVVGKMHRMGQSVQPCERKPAKRSVTGTRADNAIIFRMRSRKKRKPLKFVPDEHRTDLIGIMALTYSTCRWPIGDKPIMYCGHEVVEGKPYCEGHCERAYVRPGQASEAA